MRLLQISLLAALLTGCGHLPPEPTPAKQTILIFEGGQFIERPYEDPFAK